MRVRIDQNDPIIDREIATSPTYQYITGDKIVDQNGINNRDSDISPGTSPREIIINHEITTSPREIIINKSIPN